MIEIGHRLNLLDPMTVTDRILEDAYRQWSHIAAFTWKQKFGNTAPQRNSAFTHPRPSFLCVPGVNRQSLGYEFGNETGVLYDVPSGLFTPPDDLNARTFDSFPLDSPRSGPFGMSGLEEQTFEFSVHNHVLGCSYHFSRPIECVFLETTDLLTVIQAHEAQGTYYRQYRNASVFNNFSRSASSGSGPSISPARALEDDIMASCERCDGIVGTDGVCQRCVFAGVDLDSVLRDFNTESGHFLSSSLDRERSHMITMRTLSSAHSFDLEPGIDYSITGHTTDQGPYYTPANSDMHVTSIGIAETYTYNDLPGKISQWECRCTPTARLVLSYQGLADAGEDMHLSV